MPPSPALPPRSETTLKLSVNGKRYDIDPTDFTAIDERDFKRAVGRSLMAAFNDLDLEVIAGLLWLRMRHEEPGLTFDDVAGAVTWRSVIDAPEDEEVGEG